MAGEGVVWQDIGILVMLCTAPLRRVGEGEARGGPDPQVRVIQPVHRRQIVRSPVSHCPAGSSPSGPIKQQDVIVDLGAAG